MVANFGASAHYFLLAVAEFDVDFGLACCQVLHLE